MKRHNIFLNIIALGLLGTITPIMKANQEITIINEAYEAVYGSFATSSGASISPSFQIQPNASKTFAVPSNASAIKVRLLDRSPMSIAIAPQIKVIRLAQDSDTLISSIK